MNELSINELKYVVGGENKQGVGFNESFATGAAVASAGRSLSAAATADSIAVSAARGGAVGLAFAGGYAVGTYIYNETPIGDYLNSAVDRLTGLDGGGCGDCACPDKSQCIKKY